MTSLDFLYIALGGGFIILVIFICVLLLNLTLILRDVMKITENAREVSDRVRESVLDPLKTMSEMTAGFGFLHNIFERIRAKFEEAAEEDRDEMDAMDEESDQDEPKSKSGFLVKKLRK